jgi:hypothetical protein
MADRLRADVPDDAARQVSRGYRLAVGREPESPELRFGEQFAKKFGLEQFCLVLLNSNEFAFID